MKRNHSLNLEFCSLELRSPSDLDNLTLSELYLLKDMMLLWLNFIGSGIRNHLHGSKKLDNEQFNKFNKILEDFYNGADYGKENTKTNS